MDRLANVFFHLNIPSQVRLFKLFRPNRSRQLFLHGER